MVQEIGIVLIWKTYNKIHYCLNQTIIFKYHALLCYFGGCCTHNCRRRSARVLLAEDDASNRKVTMLMLERMGFQADAVTNGIDAFMAVESGTYDILLTNLVMPGIDGIELTRQIRRVLPPERQPRIIAITAYILPDGWRRCFEAGMDDYLVKPVDPHRLEMVLRKHASHLRQ